MVGEAFTRVGFSFPGWWSIYMAVRYRGEHCSFIDLLMCILVDDLNCLFSEFKIGSKEVMYALATKLPVEDDIFLIKYSSTP